MSLRDEIDEQYKALGRDPKKLKLEGRGDKELKQILEKLKGIKYVLDLLFSEQSNTELQIEMLKVLFNTKNVEWKNKN